MPVPVRTAFGIACRATSFVTWTRGGFIALTAAGAKYFFQPNPVISWDALYFTFGAALLWYGLTFLKHLVITVPITLSGRITILEREKTSLDVDRDRLAAALRAGQDEEARIAPLLTTIATLKAGAREIKRQWPNCTFVKFPTYRVGWSPFVGQPETGEQNPVTLDKCIAWHNTFLELLARTNRVPLRPLDFDGTMAFLDQEERIIRSLEPLPPSAPAQNLSEKQDRYGNPVHENMLY